MTHKPRKTTRITDIILIFITKLCPDTFLEQIYILNIITKHFASSFMQQYNEIRCRPCVFSKSYNFVLLKTGVNRHLLELVTSSAINFTLKKTSVILFLVKCLSLNTYLQQTTRVGSNLLEKLFKLQLICKFHKQACNLPQKSFSGLYIFVCLWQLTVTGIFFCGFVFT